MLFSDDLLHQNSTYNESYIYICDDDDGCWPMVTVCQSSDLDFYLIIAIIAASLLVASLAASWLLWTLGNYKNLYKMSKIVCCCCRVAHPTFLQNAVLLADEVKYSEILNREVESNPGLFYVKNRINGETCELLAGKLKEQLERDPLDLDEATAIPDYHDFSNDNWFKQMINNDAASLLTGKVWKVQPLHKTLRDRNLLLSYFLTFLGASCDSLDEEDHSALEELSAALEKDLEEGLVVSSLILKGWILRDRVWIQLFKVGTEKHREKSLKFLTEKKKDVNVFDRHDGNTALHFASAKNMTAVVEELIKKGAKVNTINYEGRTPLHLATLDGHLDVMKVLMEQKECNVNCKDLWLQTPLHMAAQLKLFDCAEHFVDSGASIDEKDKDGRTPLHLSALNGDFKIFKLLLDKNADVTATDDNLETALHAAASLGFSEICQLLIAGGADIDARNVNLEIPLHLAATYGHFECCQLLVDNQADANAEVSGSRPLDIAATTTWSSEENRLKCCDVIIQAGAQLDAVQDETREVLKKSRPDLLFPSVPS